MSPKISIDKWIFDTLTKHGNVRSQRDLESFVSSTGAGSTKFNKWMGKAGLRFDKKSGYWIAPMNNGRYVVKPTRTKHRPIRNEPHFKKKRNTSDNTELRAPDDDGNWPMVEFEETSHLAKYEINEIHELAKLNPGIGFREFVKNLYPSSSGKSIDSIRKILDDNVEYDLYNLLQTPIETRKDQLPNRLQKFMPVRSFDWGDILPEWERGSHHIRRFGLVNTSMMLNIRYDLRRIWNYEQDGYSINEVCFDMELPHNTVARWTNKMLDYHDKDILEDWLELVEALNSISEELNLESYEEEKDNDIYIFIRKITQSYLKSPEIWARRPRLEHLTDIFSELNSEEIVESFEELDEKEDPAYDLILIGNHLDSKTNFQVERMLNLQFYEPLLQQSVFSQVTSGANCILIDVDKNTPLLNIIEFAKLAISESESKIFIDRELNDTELFDNPITEQFESDEQQKMVLNTDTLGAMEGNDVTWMLTPLITGSFGTEALELQKMYFDAAIELCKENGQKDRLWLRPVFAGFFQPRNSISALNFNINALPEYFDLIEHLSISGHVICADFRDALQGVNSLGNMNKIFQKSLENRCIELGANCVITDVISRDQAFDTNGEIKEQIQNLFDGIGHEFLNEHSAFKTRS